jgi:tetratricopeptide (TPR) repeat protein
MKRLATAVALIVCAYADPASAQADKHAEALTRASCQAGKQSEAVNSAMAALERDEDELGPRLRLADALVDQGCYQEAVAILEGGQRGHPRSGELAGKLRDVRSLVTEQTYIDGLTQAAEGAKFQRNQLRCTRLADLTACEDALKFKPDDPQLAVARADALMQGNRPADAIAAYRHAIQLRPFDETLKSKLTAAEALQASTAAPSTELTPASAAAQVAVANSSARPKAPRRAAVAASGTAANPARASTPVEVPLPSVASLEAPTARTYSNDAPAGQTN